MPATGAKERFSDAAALLKSSTTHWKNHELVMGTEYEVGGARERAKLVRACRGGPRLGLDREWMKICEQSESDCVKMSRE